MVNLKDYVREGLDKGYSKKELSAILLDKGYSKNEINFAFSNKTEKINTPVKSDLSYLDKFKLLFSNYDEFFNRVREPGIGFAIGLASICAVISMVILTLALFMFMGVVYKSGSYGVLGIGYSIVSSVFYVIIFLVSLFIYSGITHLVIKMMGGVGSYVDSFNACTYGLIPFTILTIIPFVGWLSIIYSILVISTGLSKYHNLLRGRCALAACVPIIVLILLVIFMIFLLISLF